MISPNYHFVASGPNLGNVAVCPAQVKCRNGGLHLPSEQLGGIIAYLHHVKGVIIQPKQLNYDTVQQVLSNTTSQVIEAYAKVADVFTLPDQKDSEDNSLLSNGTLGMVGSELYKTIGEPEIIQLGTSALNSQPAEGFLTYNKYFASQQITGTIDPHSLDETSYQKFGFTEPDNKDRASYEENTLRAISAAELASLTPEQRAALRVYTSSAYEWVNAALYNESRTYREPEPLIKEDSTNGKLLAGDLLNPNKAISRTDVSKTPQNLVELTTQIDEAINSGPNKQRIVYRGLGRTLKMFSVNPVTNAPVEFSDHNVEDYVKHNMRLGEVLHFDAYQSASPQADVALSYARHYGLVYEIRTTRGLNLTAASIYETEQETLLPRDSRYMVVGVHTKATMQHGKQTRHGLTVVQLVEVDSNNQIVDETNLPTPKALTSKQLYAE